MVCISQITSFVGLLVIIGIIAIPQIRRLFISNPWLYVIIALLFLTGVLEIC